MGLDMYLTAQVTTNVEVAYWRKANAIHAWFVRECQGGVDDCRKVLVPRAQLQRLVEICEDILGVAARDPEGWKAVAAAQLPPQPGCFFGPTDLNDDYLRDLMHTYEMLTRALSESDGDLYYQSSW
jgi:hypothetical protein